ncbi:hypothetical protein PENPOL_c017G00053 [Penicillium polonicum]|uniref:Uncharacterized protein n=1 Tax=Penicillium polonicum TaxID=60169 RepID=A0A1V6N9K4_PENPO|nr:hypothetical protein PENPOL_c017G00053 [Penicillium polonicum]
MKKDLHFSVEDIGRYVSVIHKGAKYGIGGDQTTTFGIMVAVEAKSGGTANSDNWSISGTGAYPRKTQRS